MMLTGANGRYSGRSYEAIPADASVVLRRRWRWRHGWTVRGVKKETDGKEKESCCIRKLFIFLRGMVNTKEDAFLVGRRSAAASSSQNQSSVWIFKRKRKLCSFSHVINIDATNNLQNIQRNIHLQWWRRHGNLHFRSTGRSFIIRRKSP